MQLPLGTRILRFVFRWSASRYLAWRACQIAGGIRRIALSGRRKLLTIPAVTIASIVLGRRLAHHDLWTWEEVGYALAALGLASLLLLLWQGRRQVVIEAFTDWTSAEKKADPRGLATLLVGEVAALRDLYTTVDQHLLPTAVQAARPLEAAIQVEDVSSILESPAIVESKVSIGPFQVPLGTILALVGRVARGPRLIGGVHVEGKSIVLTAQLSSSEKLRAWRVAGELPATEDDKAVAVPHQMVEELALRMFTDLALDGPVRWQATREFMQGLKAIRVCLRTRQDRRQNLLEAERLLISALGEDERLRYVYYNLGVIYAELRHLAKEESEGSQNGALLASDAQASPAAAEVAFRRQIQLTPDRWEPYYALACTYYDFDRPRLDDVLNRCDRVVSLRPGPTTTAKALLVKGRANHQLGELGEAMKDRRAATAEAWFALCRSELLDEGGRRDARDLAASALQDLATTYLERRTHRAQRRALKAATAEVDQPVVEVEPFRTWYDRLRARWLLERPVRLAPSNASIRFDHGRAAWRLKRAIADFDEALRIDPAQPRFWAQLAETHAIVRAKSRSAKARDAHELFAKNSCQRALALLDCHSKAQEDVEAFRRVARAYHLLGPDYYEKEREVKAMRALAKECAKLLSEPHEAATVKRLRELVEKSSGWAEAQAHGALGRIYLLRNDAAKAVDELRAAIRGFDAQFPEEISRSNLRLWLAEALRSQGEHPRAELGQLRLAIATRPLRSNEREALADAFFQMHDYEHARNGYCEALLWSPNSATLQRKLALCHWKLAQERQDAPGRKTALGEAVDAFVRALELTTAEDLEDQFVAHYWLARLQKELGAYDAAIPYLRRATICAEAEPLVHVLLGEAYVRARGYLYAEQELAYGLTNRLAHHDHDDLGRHLEDAGWEAARVRAHAHTLHALGYAERGVLLPEAGKDIRRARAQLAKMSFARERKVSKAACEDVAGLIFLQKGDPDGALDRLEESLGLLAESETYVHFAQACLHKAESTRQKQTRLTLIRRGEAACRCAIELDVTERFADEAVRLRTELAALK
jgi:tetratricopeptide (TPR) repeat protein